MANEEHLKILKQGVRIWNRWREKTPGVSLDLSGANLRGVDLRGGAFLSRADFHGADLSGALLSGARFSEADLRGTFLSRAYLAGANLVGARLSKAHLSRAHLSEANLGKTDLGGADLGGADLSKAILNRANLGGADLSGAVLKGANLGGANLGGANLREVDLRGALVGYTSFDDLDLSAAKGLDTVRHGGPSTIGIDTIYKSHGQIPEAFLRGCGVPDTFIAYMGSLTGKAFEYYSCFISYSISDEAFAERLYNDLQGKGVRCWFAPEDIQGGKKIFDQIDQEIRLHDKTLLVLSGHSIGSQWVMTEIRRTRKAELRDKRQKLFPIRLVDMDTLKDWECFDADSGKDLAVEVREYFIPDFSNWENHAAYKPAFDRLLRDLKAEEG